MGRPQRVELPDGIYHVTARRVDRWPLFVDADDYRRYIRLLIECVELFGWKVLAFCLMPNHVHLLILIPDTNLAKGMHRLHGRYVRWFNDRHGRVGRLFEDRYHPKLVDDDLYLITVAEYIAMNPVNARLCKTPEEWVWSSSAFVAEDCPDWLANDELVARLDAISGPRPT